MVVLETVVGLVVVEEAVVPLVFLIQKQILTPLSLEAAVEVEVVRIIAEEVVEELLKVFQRPHLFQ